MLLITDVTAVTVDEKRRIITDSAIAIEKDRIVGIGKSTDLINRYANVDRLEGQGMLALPGLIDAHSHSDQALLRSVADDVTWRPFLQDIIWPMLGRGLPEDALISLKLCMLEMLKAGTTCFVDPNFCQYGLYNFDDLASLIVDMGIRAVLAKIVKAQDVLNRELAEDKNGTSRHSLTDAHQDIEKWHNAGDNRLKVWFSPSMPRETAPQCYPDFYKQVVESAASHSTGITFHWSSEKEDLTFIQQEFGMQPSKLSSSTGF